MGRRVNDTSGSSAATGSALTVNFASAGQTLDSDGYLTGYTSNNIEYTNITYEYVPGEVVGWNDNLETIENNWAQFEDHRYVKDIYGIPGLWKRPISWTEKNVISNQIQNVSVTYGSDNKVANISVT